MDDKKAEEAVSQQPIGSAAVSASDSSEPTPQRDGPPASTSKAVAAGKGNFMAALAGMIGGGPPKMPVGDSGSGEQVSISLRNVSSTEPTQAAEKPLETLGFERPKQKNKRLPTKMRKAKEGGARQAAKSPLPAIDSTDEQSGPSEKLHVPSIAISDLPNEGASMSEPLSPATTPRAEADVAQVTPRRRGFGMSVTARPTSQAPAPRPSVVGNAPLGEAPSNFSPAVLSMYSEGALKISGKIDPAVSLELTHFVGEKSIASLSVTDSPSAELIIPVLQRILANNGSLTRIDLSKCNFKASIIIDVLGALVSHSTSITEVILSDNPFGDAVILKMAVAMRYNSSLTLLDIRRCGIRGTQSASSHLSAALTPLFGRKPPCRVLIEEPHTMGIRLQNRLHALSKAHEIQISQRKYIKKVIVSSGEVVDAIKIWYSDETTKLIGSDKAGSPSAPIILADTEYIVRVSTSTGKSAGRRVLYSIALHTCSGKTYGPFGTLNEDTEEYNDPPDRSGSYGLSDIKGEASQWRLLFSDLCVAAKTEFIWEEF